MKKYQSAATTITMTMIHRTGLNPAPSIRTSFRVAQM
jgi:hypothetical protein